MKCVFGDCRSQAVADVRIVGDKWLKLCGYHAYAAKPSPVSRISNWFLLMYNRYVRFHATRRSSKKLAKTMAGRFGYHHPHNTTDMTDSWDFKQGRMLND